MKKKTKEKEKEFVRGLQVQWLFVVLGAFVALFGGLVVSALYELLRINSPAFFILVIFSIPFLFFLDLFTFTLENFNEFKKYPDGEEGKIIRRYLVFRFFRIFSWFRK